MDGVDTEVLRHRGQDGGQDDDGGAGVHDHAQQEEDDQHHQQEGELVAGDREDGAFHDIGGLDQGQGPAEGGGKGQQEADGAAELTALCSSLKKSFTLTVL